MLGEIQGCCLVKNDAEVISPLSEKQFRGQIVRCLEYNDDTQSLLLLSNCAQGLGMMDFEGAKMKFQCTVFQGWVLPPNLTPFKKMTYVAALMAKVENKDKKIFNDAVIATSLPKGEFCDIAHKNLGIEL